MRNWLKNLRTNKQMSQQSISKLLNISQNYYSNIENGERQKKLDLPLAIKISKIFEVSLDWIIEQEKNKKGSELK